MVLFSWLACGSDPNKKGAKAKSKRRKQKINVHQTPSNPRTALTAQRMLESMDTHEATQQRDFATFMTRLSCLKSGTGECHTARSCVCVLCAVCYVLCVCALCVCFVCGCVYSYTWSRVHTRTRVCFRFWAFSERSAQTLIQKGGEVERQRGIESHITIERLTEGSERTVPIDPDASRANRSLQFCGTEILSDKVDSQPKASFVIDGSSLRMNADVSIDDAFYSILRDRCNASRLHAQNQVYPEVRPPFLQNRCSNQSCARGFHDSILDVWYGLKLRALAGSL